ncbi:MAG: hypothetical protein Q9218_006630 [Villophora microphyllina]
MTQTVTLSPLDRADGSASYISNGYSIVAAVNGPIEVQRRDEIPEEAAIDVVVRPAHGVGGVRERHLESIVEKTLRQIIIVSAHPRTLIQVILQIVAAPLKSNASGSLHQSASVSIVISTHNQADGMFQNLPLLPALLQSSIFALLSTSLPLYMTMTSTLVAVSASGEIVVEPSAEATEDATSLHVLGFSSQGELLVAESEGSFSFESWEQVYDKAQHICRRSNTVNTDRAGDTDMESSAQGDLEDAFKNTIKAKTAKDQRWKDGT